MPKRAALLRWMGDRVKAATKQELEGNAAISLIPKLCFLVLYVQVRQVRYLP